jgi:hypothetical protein
MSKVQLAMAIVVILLLLLAIVLLATRIGGSSIRGASRTYEIGSLEVGTEALAPGVPQSIDVDLGFGYTESNGSSVLLMRMPERSVKIGEVPESDIRKGRVQVVLPCDSSLYGEEEAVRGRLVMVDNRTQAVLAQSGLLSLLKPGRDCAY